MNDRRHDPPAFAPCRAVADEEPVAEQRPKHVTHRRALALENFVLDPERPLHRLR